MGKQKKEAVPGELLVCRNPKALKAYDIVERFEAGVVLTGSEVKSFRARRVDLDGAYGRVEGDEIVLHKVHVAAYEHAGYSGHEPRRPRKLLLHKREIERIRGKLTKGGFTLVPLRIYFKGGWAKVELGLGKARTKGDDREAVRRKHDMREARAAVGKRRGG